MLSFPLPPEFETAPMPNPQKSLSDQCAMKAFEHLKRDELEPTPNNYAVYYFYFSGTNPGLKMAIDVLLHQQGKLSQENCNELYVAHLGQNIHFFLKI